MKIKLARIVISAQFFAFVFSPGRNGIRPEIPRKGGKGCKYNKLQIANYDVRNIPDEFVL